MKRSPFADPQAPYVFLEDRIAAGGSGWLYTDPVSVVRCDHVRDVDAAFGAIEQGLANGLHAAGLFSYELEYALEPRLFERMPPARAEPLIWMGLFNAPKAIDPESSDAGFAALGPPAPLKALTLGHDRAAHVRKVRDILDLIASGDVYQVNLTFSLAFHYDGDPLCLYAAMRAGQPVSHGGIAALGDMAVLSVSPELWVEVSGGQATARPMKGTSARGADPDSDRVAREALAADPKQRAENLMIVDLLRNDLARLSKPGSVRVTDLFTVETYPTFHALTSTITARLEPRRSLRDRVSALFPCGSIVGAPKIRAGEIIRDLELRPRGFYTGALGAIHPNGDMRFNVAIRTAVLKPDGSGRYGVGGGIVADSDPDAEYEEALLKGRLLTNLAQDYDLIETFRWSWADGFVRLDLHLARLARSAHQLGFIFNQAETRTALSRLATIWTPDTSDQRVRIGLSRRGVLTLTHAPVVLGPQILRLGIAAQRLDPADPFLRHKTTRREIHETAFSEATIKGLDEALFLNHRGEVAEASRHNVFARIDGRLVTPPLTSGALPGVLRQTLISNGEATEQRLALSDLQGATLLFIGNSLHGLRETTLIE